MYWPGLQGAFFFDDGPSILIPPGVRLTQFTWEQVASAWASGGAGPTGRPIAQLSFALNHYFSGFAPWAYKLSNLIVHVINSAMIFVVLQEFFFDSEETTSVQFRWVALIGALLWMFHPLQLLPVLHVVQRMTSLSSLFILVAFWVHMVARRKSGFVAFACLLLAWGLVWPLSVLSKETGLLLPVFVLLWELLIRRSQMGKLDIFAKIYAGVMAAVLFSVGMYLTLDLSQWLWAGYEFRPFDLTQRLFTQTRVLWFYVGLAVFPRVSAFGLYHDDFVVSRGWLEPWNTLPAAFLWLVVLWLVWYWRRRVPFAAFGLAWFLVGHLLESTVLPLEMVHEHRNYLPLLGVVICVLVGLCELVRRGLLTLREVIGIGMLGLLGCIAITALRAHQFGDELRRTLAEVQYHPNSPRAQYNLGIVLSGLPMVTQIDSAANLSALEHLSRATELDKSFKMALLELLSIKCRSGAGVDEVALNELLERLKGTLFAPSDRNVLFYVKEMAVAKQLCFTREQVASLFMAAAENPKIDIAVKAMLFSWLADYYWLSERQLSLAKDALIRSMTLNPAELSNRLKWAQLMWLSGERSESLKILHELRSERLLAEERQTLEEMLSESVMVKD